MIKITDLQAFTEMLVTQFSGFTGCFLAADERHVINKLKDKPGTWLIVVYPSAQRTGQHNSEVDKNAIWLFVLEKAIADATDQEEINQFTRLQELIIKIRDYVELTCVTRCTFLHRYEPSGTQIIPEWDEFGGYNGWSMSLVF